ncbi:accessory Sec system protein Asp3 [Weissella diestrammenae]|uniref:Accessory Sec system protein Asp3 n=1 Tax=Weissella diestrammenae TaxID=1162633 RepID=A0A7G9T5H8_9LACO|nr:accessory Sec system protein Asp3 [Weissella diestrammenae]MCM0583214.1 accessory Sec system protein Asp3 [Weissella diestrammenae]QNN75353.1 accessory Sec system protein Asp3 [Weissella diestrammenae]
MKNSVKIYWNNLATPPVGQDNLYGAILTELGSYKKKIEYSENTAPGIRIHKWNSRDGFSALRMNNDLPQLGRNMKYNVSMVSISNPLNSVWLKIDFFNQHNEIVATQSNIENEFTIETPQKFSYYEMTLIGAGVREFVFDYILIADNLKEGNNLSAYANLVNQINHISEIS